ncbi:ABC transporter substrate-binding protein [Salipiger sp. P9]|uniref:ABC transporter substrate-binding protein n=1 Tax=Salipiger pentaromativorans TaxID=2943193 RepID=UPI0021575A30|nr:ABC transporter substrate-binding protein [Salipiger pentaromativorans]MCR8550535.1 ABC transporter substrate-binding protein [Salipiger pentaromativorans]
MKSIFRIKPAVLGALSAAAVLLSLASVQAQEDRPLVRAVAADFNSIDPADTRSSQDQDLVLNLYDKLVEVKFTEREDGAMIGDPMEVIPNLAASWEVDGPVVTFHLRDDVSFYPTGNPMTADDVIYSFTRLVSLPTNGKNQASVAGLYTADQFEKLDDHTVRITYMDGPEGNPAEVAVRLTSMKFLQFGIIDSVEAKSHATEDDPWSREWLQKNVASTGPYYISSRTPNQEIVLSAVPDRSWGPQSHFDKIILRVTGDADIVSLVRGGVVDYAGEGMTGRQYSALENAGFPVIYGDTPDLLRLSMAVDKEPFTNQTVRQAMLYAIPKQQIIDVALGGRGTVATCQYNPSDATCNDSFARYDYDLDKAAALLKEAGVEDLQFDLWYSNALPYNDDVAILIKSALAQIGVTANLKSTPEVQIKSAVRDRIYRENETMSGMYFEDGVFWLPDPVTQTNCCLTSWSDRGGSWNWSRFDDAQIDDWHYTFRNSGDTEARTEAYHKIQDRLADAAANQVPLVVMGRTIATSKRVEGVTFTQEPYARYTYMKLRE